ncbi:MAG: hypothetical protein FWB80_08230 [Defluviitaleaceae bacterium]|nr:hypothetical protein [Defluviitaleaceae bacterium]
MEALACQFLEIEEISRDLAVSMIEKITLSESKDKHPLPFCRSGNIAIWFCVASGRAFIISWQLCIEPRLLQTKLANKGAIWCLRIGY